MHMLCLALEISELDRRFKAKVDTASVFFSFSLQPFEGTKREARAKIPVTAMDLPAAKRAKTGPTEDRPSNESN